MVGNGLKTNVNWRRRVILAMRKADRLPSRSLSFWAFLPPVNCGFSLYFSRISALRPWAPNPSSSANFFTVEYAFFSEALLYSTRLVRRWN